MEARLQRRIQRYGWNLAAARYEALWQTHLAAAQTALLEMAALSPGEHVLDIACGTGLVTFAAAACVGQRGHVLGIDISEQMVKAARHRSRERAAAQTDFERMDAEALDLPDANFDVVLCALGLMYVPDPEKALREMRRVMRPGGRLVVAVWGRRERCAWSALFPIVDAEVASDVCPLFFRLGAMETLAGACTGAGFEALDCLRLDATLVYADADEACDAAFIGGPVALAWSRFDDTSRQRARLRYLEALEPWRDGTSYRVPSEFVVVSAKPSNVPPSVPDQASPRDVLHNSARSVLCQRQDDCDSVNHEAS